MLNESRNKVRSASKKYQAKENILKHPITSYSNDKKENPILNEENIESYRALSNEKSNSNRQLMSGEIMCFRSNDETEILNKISDYKYLKSMGNDSEEIKRLEKINKQNYHKEYRCNGTNFIKKMNYETEFLAKKQVKFSEDISNSDLIQKTKNLLLNTKNASKISKDDLERACSHLDEKDHINILNSDSNTINSQRYRQKHNYNSYCSSKYQRQFERNKSINIFDSKPINNHQYASQYDKIPNYEYHKREQRVAYHFYKEKFGSYSPEKVFKDIPYTNQENEYFNNKPEKMFVKETIKNKIDREIFSRQRMIYANSKHSNELKEYNLMNNYQEEMSDVIIKRNVKHNLNKRNGYYQYERNMIHDKTSYLY